MAGRARLAARLLRLDDVTIVIEVDADAGGGLRAHGGELGMAGQAAKRVARARTRDRPRPSSRTRGRDDRYDRCAHATASGAIGQPAIAAPHQHVRRVQHAIGSRRIVTPLAAQRLDPAIPVVWHCAHFRVDPRVVRRDVARRRDAARWPNEIQERRTDETRPRAAIRPIAHQAPAAIRIHQILRSRLLRGAGLADAHQCHTTAATWTAITPISRIAGGT